MAGEFCQVIFFLPLSQAYTYRVPSHLVSKVQVGARVLAPLGSRKVPGVVVSLDDDLEGVPLSAPHYFATSADCDQNLILLNFSQSYTPPSHWLYLPLLFSPPPLIV
jgi:primosomal protein N'